MWFVVNILQNVDEFVLNMEGSRDFGEISSKIAQKIRRQAGKIRLRIGKQERDKGNYGYNPKRLKSGLAGAPTRQHFSVSPAHFRCQILKI